MHVISWQQFYSSPCSAFNANACPLTAVAVQQTIVAAASVAVAVQACPLAIAAPSYGFAVASPAYGVGV